MEDQFRSETLKSKNLTKRGDLHTQCSQQTLIELQIENKISKNKTALKKIKYIKVARRYSEKHI